MKKILTQAFIYALLLSAAFLYADDKELIVEMPQTAADIDAAFLSDADITSAILNNPYYTESLRYKNIANLAFLEGKYDDVQVYADEAVKWALLSDEYVRAFLANRQAGFPAKYAVRSWAGDSDCLWNIAGAAWAYNDPWKWRILYEANKDKLPDPQNPNWLEPGIVLDIPPIKGETRRGLWSAKQKYRTL